MFINMRESLYELKNYMDAFNNKNLDIEFQSKYFGKLIIKIH